MARIVWGSVFIAWVLGVSAVEHVSELVIGVAVLTLLLLVAGWRPRAPERASRSAVPAPDTPPGAVPES